MARTRIAKPYAKALLDLAVDQGTLEKIDKEMQRMGDLVRRSEDLRNVFSNPVMTTEERHRVIGELAQRLVLSTTTRNFLLVLADKRRLAHFVEIAEAFQELSDERRGVVRAEVRSPVPLSSAQQLSLKTVLEKITGKSVVTNALVDADLIGGLQVKVGGRVYDASVRTQLEQLRLAVRNAR